MMLRKNGKNVKYNVELTKKIKNKTNNLINKDKINKNFKNYLYFIYNNGSR